MKTPKQPRPTRPRPKKPTEAKQPIARLMHVAAYSSLAADVAVVASPGHFPAANQGEPVFVIRAHRLPEADGIICNAINDSKGGELLTCQQIDAMASLIAKRLRLIPPDAQPKGKGAK